MFDQLSFLLDMREIAVATNDRYMVYYFIRQSGFVF
jgi:hypothetical protein